MTSLITPPPPLAQPFAAASAAQARNLLRLSTGLRINRAADDPSGLIAAMDLRAALSILEAETRSLDRANAIASTADGYLGEMNALLREGDALAVAAANTAGMSDSELEAYQLELDSIANSVSHIAQTAEFNGQSLFNGANAIAISDDSIALDELTLASVGAIEIDGETYSLGDVVSGGSAELATNPELASQVLAAARDQISTMRGRIGAFQAHSIEPSIAQNTAATRNISSAVSFIRDTDYAAETSELVRTGVLSAAAASAFILGNRATANALSLLAA